ncbi:ADP-ribose pyrophosphatase [compost metagenome]
MHLYVGRCDSRGAGGIHGLVEEGEDIRVLVLSFNEALAAMEAGRLDNAASIIALQWLALHRERVRQTWQ